VVVLDPGHLAIAFDSDRKPIAAAWAYEIALTKSDATLALLLNLVAIYIAASDPGYRASFLLDSRFVDCALERAQDLLGGATQRFGAHAEIHYWQLFIRDIVLGEDVSDTEYEYLRQLPNSGIADLALFLRTGSSQFVDGARRFLASMDEVTTERARYFLGFKERLDHVS